MRMAEFIAQRLYKIGTFFVACSVWVDTYSQYRAHHSPFYAARMAYGIVFKGWPF
jgi:hypothetical protein